MRYTPAQVGAAADVTVHDATAIPATVPHDRDELPAEAASLQPRDARAFRARSMIGPLDGVPEVGADFTLPEVHKGHGRPDRRAVWGGTAGHTGPTVEALRPSSETLANVTIPVDLRPTSAPTQARAGSTGADPARSAVHRLWTFMRPFDQAAQYAPASVDKLPALAPIASRPLAYEQPIAGAIPSPGGAGPTAMDPARSQPNTARLIPRPWDSLLVNTGTTVPGGPAAPAASSSRAAGWRAR